MNERDIKTFTGRYGGYWRDDILDFCYLTNPYFPPDAFIESLFSSLRRALKFYPSTQAVVAGFLADYLDVHPDTLFVGNGGSEGINILNRLFPGPMLIPVPAFNEYENNRIHHNLPTLHFDLTEENRFALDVERFIEETRRRSVSSAVVITPNNPTGNVLTRDEVFFLLENSRHLECLVVDESFVNFSYQEQNDSSSVLQHLDEFPHCCVLASMSKDYGIPGLRLGYVATGNRSTIKTIRQSSPIWNINALAEIFLEKLRFYKEDFEQSRLRVVQTTRELFEQLSCISFLSPFAPKSNFVFSRVDAPFTSQTLTRRLLVDYDLFINDTSNKPHVGERYVRIASRDEHDNKKLVAALGALAGESA